MGSSVGGARAKAATIGWMGRALIVTMNGLELPALAWRVTEHPEPHSNPFTRPCNASASAEALV